MREPSFEFTHAITRKPGASAINGLRAVDRGAPELKAMSEAHDHYVLTLREAGAEVIQLPALEAFPDASFVEDTALCLPQGAILMNPGAPTRAGEVLHMAQTLEQHFDKVLQIDGPATIEGGDILVTGREILVGLSDRTNLAGVQALERLVQPWGYAVRAVSTPPDVLHFKTDCSLLDANTILSTQKLASSGCFEGYNIVLTAAGEEACANSIRYNQYVIMPKGFANTRTKLAEAGYEIREIDNTDCAKIDGGMSCLSLRF